MASVLVAPSLMLLLPTCSAVVWVLAQLMATEIVEPLGLRGLLLQPAGVYAAGQATLRMVPIAVSALMAGGWLGAELGE